ncbi:MAG TPA: DMT family transporter, partial [Gemmataceae bacterium]|nr:DMT family transporter [Gemmataceae bacterium]
MSHNSKLPYFWMLLGTLAFAIMSTLANVAGGSCDWQVIAMSRSGLAFTFTALWAILAGVKLVLWRPGTLWLRSIAGSISLVSTFYALTRLPVSDVITLTNVFPIWVAVLSWPILKERPSAQVWIAVIIGVTGIVLIQQPHLSSGNFAAAVALLSSFTTAIAMMGLHRLQGVDPRAVVVHFSGVSFLFALLALAVFPNEVTRQNDWNGKNIGLLVAIGMAAAVGQLFLTKAFAAGPPAKVAVVGLTQIVWAVLLDWLVLGRSFSSMTLIGIAL